MRAIAALVRTPTARAIAVLVLALAGPATGARAQDIVAAYRATWALFPAAEIRLDLGQTARDYRDEIRIETEGLPRWVTHFRTVVAVRGRLAGDGRPQPARYDADYDLHKRRHGDISMDFVTRDGVAIADRAHPDTSSKPQLAPGFRSNVVDPLSTLTAIRATLRQRGAALGPDFAIPVYDGARRFDVRVHLVGRDRAARVIRLVLTLVPIAGFKGESSSDGDPDTAPRPVEVALTDDARLLPVYFRVNIAFLPFTVTFDHLCPTLDRCAERTPTP